jgi:hypothetical protein
MTERLLCKREVLSLNPILTKKKKEEEEKNLE